MRVLVEVDVDVTGGTGSLSAGGNAAASSLQAVRSKIDNHRLKLY